MKKITWVLLVFMWGTIASCGDRSQSEIPGLYFIERSRVEGLQDVRLWDFSASNELTISGDISYRGTWQVNPHGRLVIEIDFEPMAGVFEFEARDGLLILTDSRYTIILDKSFAPLLRDFDRRIGR